MMVSAGIDVGSTYTKTVLMDSERRVVGRAIQAAVHKILHAVIDRPRNDRLAGLRRGRLRTRQGRYRNETGSDRGERRDDPSGY